MSRSLFAVTTRSGNITSTVNVLAADSSTVAALQTAIAATVSEAGAGAEFRNAYEVGGKSIDLVIAAAVSPATDGAPKALYQVAFRSGSGTDGSTPAPLLVQAWPQTNAAVSTSAEDLAIEAAATAGGIPNNITRLADVDIDTTTA